MLYPPLPRGSRWRAAAFVLFLVGAIARVAVYFEHKSLWYDEAALALNIVDRGFIGLLAPLIHSQIAPPLFLWVERIAVLLFGPNEWALRAVPLAAGLATPPVMWRFVRQVLPPPAALIAVAFVALSPTLVRYAAEAKPYAVDALVTLVLCERAVACVADGATRRAWWLLAVSGVVGISLSTPAPFVLAGVVAFLGVRALLARDRRVVARVAALAASWAVVFVALLMTVFQAAASPTSQIGAFMRWYWAANFLTTDPPGLRTKVSAMSWALLSGTFFGPAAPPGATTILAATVALGTVALLVRRNALAALLVVPFAVTIFASALRRYPIAERLMLFAAPLTAVLMGSALLALRRFGNRSVSWFAGVATAGIALIAILGTVRHSQSADGRQESRELVQAAERMRRDGVSVWVSGGGAPAFLYYSTHGSLGRSDEAEAKREVRPKGEVVIGAWNGQVPEIIVTHVGDTAAVGRSPLWGATQAAKLRALARPCALAFLSNTQEGEADTLLASARRLGGRVEESRRAVGAELHRVCFNIS